MPSKSIGRWAQRPPEVRTLLNPAFCSLVLRSTAQSYSTKAQTSLPAALGFLVLPIVLHKPTRDNLPATARSKIHVWIRENPIVRIGFSRRAIELVPYTREALLFGLSHGSLRVNSDGDVASGATGGAFRASAPSEARRCLDAAVLLGKLFAAAGDAGTVLVAWGVRP